MPFLLEGLECPAKGWADHIPDPPRLPGASEMSHEPGLNPAVPAFN